MQSPIASNALAFLTSILFQGWPKQAQTVFLKFQFSMGIAVKRYNFLKVVNLHTYIYIDITYIFIHLHVCIFPELWSVVQEEPIKMPGSHLIYCFLNYLKNIIISVGTWRSHVDIRFTHILCSYLFTISLKNLPIVNVN